MYHINTILPLILLVSEMLKISIDRVGAHFLEKFAFVTNKCLTQDAFGKHPKKTEDL